MLVFDVSTAYESMNLVADTRCLVRSLIFRCISNNYNQSNAYMISIYHKRYDKAIWFVVIIQLNYIPYITYILGHCTINIYNTYSTF